MVKESKQRDEHQNKMMREEWLKGKMKGGIKKMKKYRIVEEITPIHNIHSFIPEIKTWKWGSWKRWYRMRGGDDPCPPLIKFDSLQDARENLLNKLDQGKSVAIIHSFQKGG